MSLLRRLLCPVYRCVYHIYRVSIIECVKIKLVSGNSHICYHVACKCKYTLYNILKYVVGLRSV